MSRSSLTTRPARHSAGTRRWQCGLAASAALLAAGCSSSTTVPMTAASRPAVEVAPAVPPAAPAKHTLPGITMDPRTGEIEIEGIVCIEKGILEYAAVATEGKKYESLFELKCRPSQLNVMMLIAGYVAGDVPRAMRGDFATDDPAASQPTQPAGAPTVTPPPPDHWRRTTPEPTRVTLSVDVREPDGEWKRRSIESFLVDRRTGQCPGPLTWAFTGSFFHRDPESRREFYVADVERSVAALWYDPTALLNLLAEVGNPYRGSDAGLEVNPAGLPPLGTPIRLVLRPVR